MLLKNVNISKDITLESFNLIETIRHVQEIILEERGFQGGSDEKMGRMWLRR